MMVLVFMVDPTKPFSCAEGSNERDRLEDHLVLSDRVHPLPSGCVVCSTHCKETVVLVLSQRIGLWCLPDTLVQSNCRLKSKRKQTCCATGLVTGSWVFCQSVCANLYINATNDLVKLLPEEASRVLLSANCEACTWIEGAKWKESCSTHARQASRMRAKK